MHPPLTKGGLRIGKEMNERRPGDPLDERLEWDRDVGKNLERISFVE